MKGTVSTRALVVSWILNVVKLSVEVQPRSGPHHSDRHTDAARSASVLLVAGKEYPHFEFLNRIAE
jgi:hypothetical protein